MSIARRTFPSRLELKRRAGSCRDAPLAKVSFTTLLYDSPVQMMPSCDQTGVPGDEDFTHFNSSTASGSASLTSLRILLRVSPRQSPSSAIRFEMSSDADWPWLAPCFFMFSSFSLLTHFKPRRERRDRCTPRPCEQTARPAHSRSSLRGVRHQRTEPDQRRGHSRRLASEPEMLGRGELLAGPGIETDGAPRRSQHPAGQTKCRLDNEGAQAGAERRDAHDRHRRIE